MACQFNHDPLQNVDSICNMFKNSHKILKYVSASKLARIKYYLPKCISTSKTPCVETNLALQRVAVKSTCRHLFAMINWLDYLS